MKKTMLAAAALLAFGSGTAHAASSCPPFPPTVLKYEPIDNPIARDTSKSAKDIAAAAGDGSDHWRYQAYSLEEAATLSRKVGTAAATGGGQCGGLTEVTFKLGVKRTIAVAKESTVNSCVEDAFASQAQPIIKAEDAAIAQFGNSVATTYANDVKAIGVVQGANQDAVQAQIKEKLSALFNDKVYPAFEKALVDSHKTVNLAGWQPAECDGETKKVVASLSGTPTKVEAPPPNPSAVAPPVPQPRSYGGGR